MTLIRALDPEGQALLDSIKNSKNPFLTYLDVINKHPDSDGVITQHLMEYFQEIVKDPNFAAILGYQDGSLANSSLVGQAIIKLSNPYESGFIPDRNNIQQNLVKARPLDALSFFDPKDRLLTDISLDDLIKQASNSNIIDIMRSLNSINNLKPEFVEKIPQIISAAKPEQLKLDQELINQLISELSQKYYLDIIDLEQAVKQSYAQALEQAVRQAAEQTLAQTFEQLKLTAGSSLTSCNLLEMTKLPWEYIPSPGSDTPAARLNISQPGINDQYLQLKNTPNWQGIDIVTGPDVGLPHNNTGNTYVFLPPESVKILASRLNEKSNACEVEHPKTTPPITLGEFLGSHFKPTSTQIIFAHIENRVMQNHEASATTQSQGEPAHA